jgi:protocatechuate 3,4-dioxygenase beta subunit
MSIREKIEIPSADAFEFDKVIPPVAKNLSIHGVVLGPDNRPMPNATVSAARGGIWATATITSGPTGRFTLEFDEQIAPRVEFRAVKNDLITPKPVLESNGQVTLRLKANVWSTIEGEVVDPEGSPVPGAVVTVRGSSDHPAPLKDSTDPADRTSSGVMEKLGEATSDSHGHFVIAHVLPMDHMAATVKWQKHPDFQGGDDVAVGVGQHVDMGQIRLSPPQNSADEQPANVGPLRNVGPNLTTGFVKRGDIPAVGLLVTILELPGFSARTDARGRFEFHDLPSSDYLDRNGITLRIPINANRPAKMTHVHIGSKISVKFQRWP